MNYYRLTGDSTHPVEWRIQVPVWEGSRVECCFVDSSALSGLNKLIAGPLTTAQELRQAEIALRAFIFHDEVRAVRPAISLQHISSLDASPLILTPAIDDSPDYPALKELTADASFMVHLWPIDRLVRFSDLHIENEYLNRHAQRRSQLLSEDAKIDENNSRSQLIARYLCEDMGTYEFVCASEDEYYRKAFSTDEDLIGAFLKPLPATHLANYLANPIYQQYQDRICTRNAVKFFSALDRSWEQHQDLIEYHVEIPMHPFTSILLARAATREELVSEILLMRQEFKDARDQLWERFDDSKLRNFNPSVTRRALTDIEEAARSIVPRAFATGENWMRPLLFRILGYLLSLLEGKGAGKWDSGQIAEGAAAIASSTVAPIHLVDAARITSDQLKDIDWNNLCERHFSHYELERLKNWRW